MFAMHAASIAAALAALVATLPSLGCSTRRAEARPTAVGCELVTEGYGPAGTVPGHAEVVAPGPGIPWGVAFPPNCDLLVTGPPGGDRIGHGGYRPPPLGPPSSRGGGGDGGPRRS